MVVDSRLSTRVAIAAAFAAVFALAFWPTFIWMAERFDAHDSFYSHGWLVPLASGWLLWQRRERLRSCRIRSSAWGLALLVPSLIAHLGASWLKIGFVSGLAMIGVITGLVWAWWGREVLKTLRFPLLFLLFMVPLPGVLLIAASFNMKLMAASLATMLLDLIGIPAQQAGSSISVPGVTVIVDDTCSGLRSLISLVALSVVWTSFMGKGTKTWKKLTVVASSIPIALAANMVRIMTLVLVAAIYGAKAADGFIHYGSGLVVFGVALVCLAWVSRTLTRGQDGAA